MADMYANWVQLEALKQQLLSTSAQYKQIIEEINARLNSVSTEEWNDEVRADFVAAHERTRQCFERMTADIGSFCLYLDGKIQVIQQYLGGKLL